MIELIQFPWSPFCIVQRRILEYARAPFKITNIPTEDRTLVWKLTRGRYYGVPVIRDGRTVVFETSEDSQVIAKYLDQKLNLNLFPRRFSGLQRLLWHHIETESEGRGFKLNDIHWEEFVPARERPGLLRYKERKFGRGCIDSWRRDQKILLKELKDHLVPFELMLGEHSFLLDDRPRFVDFDLYGMLANFLHSGHYRLPSVHPCLRHWYERMRSLKPASP
jgi:glutathione S-transferase